MTAATSTALRVLVVEDESDLAALAIPGSVGLALLQSTDRYQGRAAHLLGISPKTLYRKIREHGFRRPDTVRGK